MEIHEIVSTIIRGEQALKFPLAIYNGWVRDAHHHHVLDIRGWGYLQYAKPEGRGEQLQDAIGEWVVKTLNEEAKRQGLLTV